MAYKIGILTTHPIQYQVPWFRALEESGEIEPTVFYCMLPDAQQQGDGFGVPFHWDIPLLEGYQYELLHNKAREPSLSHFFGCDTPGIRKTVRQNGFDAFIVNGWVVKSCVQLLRACRKYNTPCIVRGESNAIRPRPWWKRTVHRQLLSKYAAFLNIGKANKDFYLQNGVVEEMIFFAPYCVENHRFEAASAPLRPQRKEIRSEWGVPPSAFTYLFCAKFIDKKRPLDLLRALPIACNKMGNQLKHIHLLMVGEGELKTKCEEFVKQNCLPVTFAGFLNQSEIARAYVASDCIVLPSDYGETWGLVVNEAMACGLPAIVSDRVGCHRDLVIPRETGAVYPFGDINSLTEYLLSFAENPDRTKAMGEKAKKRIKKYSVEEVVRGTISAVNYACHNKRH